MSGFTFSVERVPPQSCQAHGCMNTARNAVRMFFPVDAGPYIVCGHHKAWAKKQCREARLRAALAIYADPENWSQNEQGVTSWAGGADDPSVYARAALAGPQREGSDG